MSWLHHWQLQEWQACHNHHRKPCSISPAAGKRWKKPRRKPWSVHARTWAERAGKSRFSCSMQRAHAGAYCCRTSVHQTVEPGRPGMSHITTHTCSAHLAGRRTSHARAATATCHKSPMLLPHATHVVCTVMAKLGACCTAYTWPHCSQGWGVKSATAGCMDDVQTHSCCCSPCCAALLAA